jgi:hypothetical protein
MAEAIGEGPKAMEFLIGDIFTALERTKHSAQAWAHSQPEHDEALGKFIKDLDQIELELRESVVGKASLQSSYRGSTVNGNIFGIINCLTHVTGLAALFSEEQPEYTAPLKRFQEEIYRVKGELTKKVFPGAV